MTTFSNALAYEVICFEFGCDTIAEIFSELSPEPVAVSTLRQVFASNSEDAHTETLAQIYKGKLLNGDIVSVKV